MRILFNDVIQYSDAPKEIKSPALSEMTSLTGPVTITLDRQYPINAIGIGGTDGIDFTITFNDANNTVFQFQFTESGLYLMDKTVDASVVTIASNASYIGRIGAGIGVHIPTAIAKEPAFCSTAEPRTTLSGQVIPGAGGYNYRTVSLDSRYKIGPSAMGELKAGYSYIGKGCPFFIDLSVESYKLPFPKLYAVERNQRQMSFESGVRRFLYSRRFEFEERF
jgi:hypothetical protein